MVKKVVKTNALSKQEIEEIIVSLANAGHSPSKIGLILRDENGIKNVRESTGKHLQQILSENKLIGDIPEDLLNLIKKSVSLNNHLNKNKKDDSAKRGYELTVSKIRNLSKYYIKKGKLPLGWKYTSESAALLVK
ncbi:MAG: 30S ribosomal protein S15 [Candidatus ainarchaeum sp.]|nr:30S ribosomal protein S15 [Candidatus ainarchaeum sp.]